METRTYFIPVIIRTEAVVEATSLKEAYANTKIKSIPSIDGFMIDYSRDVEVLEDGCSQSKIIYHNQECKMDYYTEEMEEK